jgi:N-acetylmuramoyl-L-alanine amidase
LTIGATATPSADTLYRIWVRDNGMWSIVSDYSTINSVVYTPKYGGKFVVQIDVKNKYSSTSTYDDAWSQIYDIYGEKSCIQSVNISGSINSGKTMNISIKSNDDENTLFRIWLRENNEWKLLSDFSDKSSVSYTPKYKGPYVYQVEVKNKKSGQIYDDAKSEFLYTPPKDITIVIDPGHGLSGGNYDVGAHGEVNGVTYYESQLNLNIALKLYSQLISRGYNVIMTRTTEKTGVDFYDRPMYANKADADLYICIHNNAASSAAVGTEVLYQDSSDQIDSKILDSILASGLPDPRVNNSARIANSKSLSEILVNNISSSIAFNNRGAKEQNLYVCRNTIMPAVLIECGFLTNQDELAKLLVDDRQLTIARAIAISIDQYLARR